MKWYSGLNNFIRNTFVPGTDGNEHLFTCEILDVPLMPYNNLVDIFRAHLEHRQTSIVEVLYSGGVDSELTLQTIKKTGIPVQALTMEMRVKNMIINAHDLYYAQNFCREHDITQKIVTFHADKFFENGDQEDYLVENYLLQPSVATQFWLYEQASHFPVIGGDWPWLQTHNPERCLSPWRYEFSVGDLFMRERGIHGINNMIGYSLDSCRFFVNHHYKMFQKYKTLETTWGKIGLFKHEMFANMDVTVEARLKAYGWELLEFQTEHINVKKMRENLQDRVGLTRHAIKWNSVMAQAADMLPGQNSSLMNDFPDRIDL
jgi:hypothetical protein